MQPTKAIVDEFMKLLAQDTTTIAPAAGGVKVHLAMANFVPSEARVLGDFTEANFAGYAALVCGVGNQLNFVDPVLSQRVIELLAPAGGFHWQTTGVGNLPQTIYGYYVTDNAVTTVYGSALLQTPVTLTVAAQGLDVPNIRLTLTPNSIN